MRVGGIGLIHVWGRRGAEFERGVLVRVYIIMLTQHILHLRSQTKEYDCMLSLEYNW